MKCSILLFFHIERHHRIKIKNLKTSLHVTLRVYKSIMDSRCTSWIGFQCLNMGWYAQTKTEHVTVKAHFTNCFLSVWLGSRVLKSMELNMIRDMLGNIQYIAPLMDGWFELRFSSFTHPNFHLIWTKLHLEYLLTIFIASNIYVY